MTDIQRDESFILFVSLQGYSSGQEFDWSSSDHVIEEEGSCRSLRGELLTLKEGCSISDGHPGR